MRFNCVFGTHKWDGCKCKHCSKTRSIHHDWEGCKCKRCGKTRDELHDCEGCKCSRCGKENHNWITTTDEDHIGTYEILTCDKCGKTKSM